MKSLAQFVLIVFALVALAFSTAAISQWAGDEGTGSRTQSASPAPAS